MNPDDESTPCDACEDCKSLRAQLDAANAETKKVNEFRERLAMQKRKIADERDLYRQKLSEEIEYSKQTKKDFEEAHTKLLDTRAEHKIAVDCGIQLADERDHLRAENERLTAAMNRYSNDEIMAETKIQKVEAENARLRSALREIGEATEKDFSSTFPTYSYEAILLIRKHCAAKAAIENK